LDAITITDEEYSDNSGSTIFDVGGNVYFKLMASGMTTIDTVTTEGMSVRFGGEDYYLIGPGADEDMCTDLEVAPWNIPWVEDNDEGNLLYWYMHLHPTRFSTISEATGITLTITVSVTYVQEEDLPPARRRALLRMFLGDEDMSSEFHWLDKHMDMEEELDYTEEDIRRFLQEGANYDYATDFYLMPFKCSQPYTTDGVYPGQYVEVPCVDRGGSMFIYCDNDGWNLDLAKDFCDQIVSTTEMEAATVEEEEESPLLLFLITGCAFLCTCCLFCYFWTTRRQRHSNKKMVDMPNKRKSKMKKNHKEKKKNDAGKAHSTLYE